MGRLMVGGFCWILAYYLAKSDPIDWTGLFFAALVGSIATYWAVAEWLYIRKYERKNNE